MYSNPRRGATFASFFVIAALAVGLPAAFSGHFFSALGQEPSAPKGEHPVTFLFGADAKGQLDPCK